MQSFDYKGMNSTRVKLVVYAWISACLMLLGGLISGAEWVTTTLGSVVAYALSEVGVKGAAAYKDRVP